MIEIDVPGYRLLRFEHLVLDYNGTIACDGQPLAGLEEAIDALRTRVQIHILTADTLGRARQTLGDLPCTLHILAQGDEARGKLAYVRDLGADRVVCIGNGRIDRLMLQEAALGIAVVQQEGLAVETLCAAKVLCPTILAALELLLHPHRLIATLRA